MAKLLVSWIAYNNDFIRDNTVFKAINEDGPHYQLHKHFYSLRGYDRHILLYSEPKQEGYAERLAIKLRADFQGHQVEERLLPLKDIIDLSEVKTKVEGFLLEHAADDIDIYFSPGTSIMQLSWYICHQSLGLRTRLIQTKSGKLTADSIPVLTEIEVLTSEAPVTAILKENRLTAKETADSDYELTDSIRPVYERAYLVAQTDKVTAFIRGESGTGKEHLARFIHEQSIRKNAPFIPVNCAALAEDLLESRLFGYKKGAFTGAEKDTPGLFSLADTGTIFLDEIGDITPKMQQALLRVLQEREVQPIGSTPVKVDVRVVAATNAPLEELCREGKFRWDLYYRLCVAELELPTMFDRGKQELAIMLDFFVDKKKAELNKKSRLSFSKDAKQMLLNYTFPGNIRELENLVESLYVFCQGEVKVEELPKRMRQPHTNQSLLLKDAEREHILRVLQMQNGNQRQTALALGVSINTLKAKLRSYEEPQLANIEELVE